MKKAITLENPIACPCCAQKVRTPSLEIVIDSYGVPPLEASILGAIWRGRGMPVQTEPIFCAMYHDDPDGGPSQNAMYRAFKVALCHLRKRLRGSGITVENCGYRAGYRLVIGDAARQAENALKNLQHSYRRRPRHKKHQEVYDAPSSRISV